MTIWEAIIKHFEECGDWEFAGAASSKLSNDLKRKASNIERRMRDLSSYNPLYQAIQARYGKLEAQTVENPAGGPPVVQYRLKEKGESTDDLLSSMKPVKWEIICDADTGREIARIPVYG